MRSIFMALLLVAALLVGCRAPAARATSGTTSESIQVNGRQRTYRLHLPDGSKPTTATPLVLAFHGRGGQGEGMESLTGLSATADAHGFIVAYPDGIGRGWHYGLSEVDDVAFVDALIDRLVSEDNVDTQRVYATGLSDGGFFSEFLGCASDHRVAAIAPVGASLTGLLALHCAGAGSLPVLMISGTEDPLVPYTGSTSFPGRLLSVPESIGFWVGHDGLSSAPVVDEWLADTDPADGTRTHHTSYGSGQVDLLTVEGGGHTWPGGLQYLPVASVGRTSRDFSANERIWAFFTALP